MERKDCITCGYTIPCFRCENNEDYPAWVPNKLGTDLTSRAKEITTGTTEEAKHLIAGVGVDAPTVTNEQGGKQSVTNYAFDALDGQAMFAMCKVLHEGRIKYGSDENWRKIPAREHWNHMVIHAFAWIAGDKSDDHLSHIMCRAMFLYATANGGVPCDRTA